MSKTIRADVGIVGGGVTGLFLTQMLSERGFRVVLIEQSDRLADGPSTRNEGWLHSGAYHVAAILERRIAIQVARRVRFGYEKVRAFCPEAVEDEASRTFALVDDEKLDEVKSRWDEAEVKYAEVPADEFGHIDSRVSVPTTTAVFEVRDVSINTRVLYQQLATWSLKNGARIFLNSTVDSICEESAIVRTRGKNAVSLKCKLFIYAAGFGIKELFLSKFDFHLPLRCFVSHLLDLPRVCAHGVFAVNQGEATIMHHADWSIVGTNADQIYVPTPQIEVDAERIEDVKRALKKLVKNVTFNNCHGRACVKVDMGKVVQGSLNAALPQLNVSCGEPIPNHIWVLPGKMTEAPSIADFLSDYLSKRLGFDRKGHVLAAKSTSRLISRGNDSIYPVAFRPLDTWIPLGDSQAVSTQPASSKLERFDAFLSYNRSDETAVLDLAKQLKSRGLKVWLDLWELAPSKPWEAEMEKIVESCGTAVTLVGPAGFGQWDKIEMGACVDEFVSRGLPVIPVLLPGAPTKLKLPFFLKQFAWIDVRHGLTKKGLDLLQWGISGRKRSVKSATAKSKAKYSKVSFRRWVVTGEDLYGRDSEMATLDKAWNDKRTNLISIIGWGGVGKSALVNHWLGRMAIRRFRGAERVFGWSFYSLGGSDEKAASVEEFVGAALAEMGYDASATVSLWDRVDRLLELVRKERMLLLLDGLEPLQHASGPSATRLKDASMQRFLRDLAADNSGLCVVTSRQPIPEIAHLTSTTALRIDLKDLNPSDGARLLKKLGVKGTGRELATASKEFGNHALTLTLLGGYLRERWGGLVARRHEVERHRELFHGNDEQGRHAAKIMASYAKEFGEGPKIAVLKLIGLFDRRADSASLEALRQPPPIKDLTDGLFKQVMSVTGNVVHREALNQSEWDHIVWSLRRTHLLSEADERDPETLDAHPLVREYFRKYVEDNFPAASKEGHARLFEHFKNAAPEFPETRQEMDVLYTAMVHGCRADLHDEALKEVYGRRIHQGTKGQSFRNLGAYEAELAMLSEYFESLWDQPVKQLADANKPIVLGLAGSRLRALGRLREAITPLKRSLELHRSQQNLVLAAVRARHLSEVYCTLGDIAGALKCAKQGMDLVDEGQSLPDLLSLPPDPTTSQQDNTRRNNLVYERIVQLTIRGTILHQQGRREDAKAAFSMAESIQAQAWPRLIVLFSLWGFRFCDLLLDDLEFSLQPAFEESSRKLEERFNQMRELPHQLLETTVPEANLALVGKGLEDLFLARYTIIKSRRSGERDSLKVTAEIRQAIDNLRIANRPEYIPLGLLTRAALHGEIGEFDSEERDLKDALEIAKSGEMRLFEVDCHLEYTRLRLARYKMSGGRRFVESGRKSLSTAETIIEEIGYHRRDLVVSALSSLLCECERDHQQERIMAKKHVFISYYRKNKPDVAQLHKELIAAGEAVWWDGDILGGQDWKLQIRRAMKDSYAVILCLSKELSERVASGVYPEVADAIAIFRQQAPGSIFIIPVRLSDCAIPDIEIDDTRTLDRLQRIDLFPPAHRAAGVQNVLKALRASPHHPFSEQRRPTGSPG